LSIDSCAIDAGPHLDLCELATLVVRQLPTLALTAELPENVMSLISTISVSPYSQELGKIGKAKLV
jgi:hypothetical protein